MRDYVLYFLKATFINKILQSNYRIPKLLKCNGKNGLIQLLSNNEKKYFLICADSLNPKHLAGYAFNTRLTCLTKSHYIILQEL